MRRVKTSFNAGEISPLLYGRHDFERYKDGCKTLRNMVLHPQGPVSRRTGLKFIVDMSNIFAVEYDSFNQNASNKTVRLVPFIFSTLQAYVYVFYIDKGNVCRMIILEDGEVYTQSGSVYTLACSGLTPLSFDYSASKDELYIAQGDIFPKVITRSGSVGAYTWTYGSMTGTGLHTPADYDTPEWGSTPGYPRCVCFHQQRLVFASNTLYPQKIWMSIAGSFLDFHLNEGDPPAVLDTSGIGYTLDSGEQDRIEWLCSADALTIGTVGSVWTVTGTSLQNVITPTAFVARMRNASGCERIKPVVVGPAVLYVERFGRSISEFVYDYNVNGYKTNDMSILAPHLTDKIPVYGDIAFQRAPDSILWCIGGHCPEENSYAFLGLTYQRDHKVVGWHRHDTEGGTLAGLTTIPDSTNKEDVLYAAVMRNVSGTYHILLEVKFPNFRSESHIELAPFLDSAIRTSGAVTSISAPHLAGRTVSVLADGAVHPDVTLDANGDGDLIKECTDVTVGLPFRSVLNPTLLFPDLDSGAAFGRMQQIKRLMVAVYRTVGFMLGYYDDALDYFEEEVPFRVPADLAGMRIEPFTGNIWLDFPEGHSIDPGFDIIQQQPLPMTVIMLVDDTEFEE